MRGLALCLALILIAAPAAWAVEDAELAEACRQATQGAADCPCFVRVARAEMDPLQRDALFVQLTGNDAGAAATMGDGARQAYLAALTRVQRRVARECAPVR